MGAPSDTGSNGRLPNGQFGPSNRFGKGNSHAIRMRDLRGAVLDATTPEMVGQIIKRMALAALKDGDVAAAKVVLEYACGRPVQGIELAGPDGEPLGLDVARLIALITEALPGDRFAEARFAVAARFKQLSTEADDAGRDP
jgi:hypothetical protein